MEPMALSPSLHEAVSPLLASVHLLNGLIFLVGAVRKEAPGVLTVAGVSNMVAAYYSLKISSSADQQAGEAPYRLHRSISAACALVSWGCHLLVRIHRLGKDFLLRQISGRYINVTPHAASLHTTIKHRTICLPNAFSRFTGDGAAAAHVWGTHPSRLSVALPGA
jgi:hypothetical protein